MMNDAKWATLSMIVILTIIGSTGCLRRKETITVMPNGTIRLSLDFEGDREDIEQGDAMPDSLAGWQVTRLVEKGDDDKDSHILRATKTIEEGSPLPDTYALPDDPDGDLYLQFPTTYTTEQRADGTYHIFRRVYPERAWADLQYWEDFFIEDQHRKLAEKPVDELTDEERNTLFQAFAAVEAHKQQELADQALRESHPSLPVWVGLQARQALLDTYKDADVDAIGDRCISIADPDQRALCFDRETDRLHTTASLAYKTALMQAASLNHGDLVAFDQAMARAWKRHDLTGQLAGHYFEITVQMPGELVAHNGFRVEESEGHVTADWEFDGRAFRDRSLELILVTREPTDQGADGQGQSDGR